MKDKMYICNHIIVVVLIQHQRMTSLLITNHGSYDTNAFRIVNSNTHI